MMRFRWPTLVVLALTLLAGCHGSDGVVTQPSMPAGAMSYTGYDESGRPAVRGWLRLDLMIVAAEAGDVTGEWDLHALAGAGDVGPQIGHGVVEGGFVDGRFVANLNPGKTDDNVVLDGTVTVTGGPASRMSYEGTWTWHTLAGPKRSGAFRASE